ncbi:Uncharacterised protein [Nocardia otitidiscaviarum]|uniref:UsfY protein n=1 Tax=Nocardia otitidiscaviarum TaxID=1823 RepID=A0A379JL98_9NOCA|nr:MULTISPECIES: hypothetical protein [Nocardia]MCP9618626.1 hypothetical protein [Nocardia otitidiscaviarum]SUD48763.1 Uncharacterised protein [Nocardia otitidiscaviarum]
MTRIRHRWTGSEALPVFARTELGRRSRRVRHHAGEGIEDGYNVPGIVLCGLGVVALALALTAAGYGFTGWATIAAFSCAALLLCGALWLYVEWRRDRRHHPDPTARQGH